MQKKLVFTLLSDQDDLGNYCHSDLSRFDLAKRASWF
jgi:hypothetical protein